MPSPRLPDQGRTTEFFMDAIRISLTPSSARFSGVIVRCLLWLSFSGFLAFPIYFLYEFPGKARQFARSLICIIT